MEKFIGHYRIVSELGRGGMGVVYKAHEQSLNRFVALKVLGEHLCEDQSYVDRFIREAQSAAALNHPNIVQVYAISEHEGQQFFAMEYVTGDSIQGLIRAHGRIDPAAAAGLILQAAAGLGAAHSEGIIHRDIKPANLMVDDRGLVKIADFGLALLSGGATRLTATGMFMGTPGYLSPEQCLDQDVDHRADIYSLGVALFEMLTGTVPFKADSPLALIRQIVDVEPPSVTELNPDVPTELRTILEKMMHKDRDQRYPDCEPLVADLQQWLTSVGADGQAVLAVAPGASVKGAARAGISTQQARATTATAEQLDDDPTVQVDSAEIAGDDAAPPASPPPPPPSIPEGGLRDDPTVVMSDETPVVGGEEPEIVSTPAELPEKTGSRRNVIVALAVAAALLIAFAGVAGLGMWKLGVFDSDTVVAADTEKPRDLFGEPEADSGDSEASVLEQTEVDEAIGDVSSTAEPGAVTTDQPTTGSPSTEPEPPKTFNAGTKPSIGPSMNAETSTDPPKSTSAPQYHDGLGRDQVAEPVGHGVALISGGETLLAGEAEAYVRNALEKRGLEVFDGRGVPGVHNLLSSGEVAADPQTLEELLRPHARWAVVVRAEYLGDRPLMYQGQRDVEFQARLHVVAHDLLERRPLGRGIHVKIGYTQLSVERKVAEALRPRLRQMAQAMEDLED